MGSKETDLKDGKGGNPWYSVMNRLVKLSPLLIWKAIYMCTETAAPDEIIGKYQSVSENVAVIGNLWQGMTQNKQTNKHTYSRNQLAYLLAAIKVGRRRCPGIWGIIFEKN